MLIFIPLLAAVVVAILGLVILWANPARTINRAVLLCSANISVWLACWYCASQKLYPSGFFWYKCTCSAGALIALSFWIVKETILAKSDLFTLRWVRRNWVWFTVSV